MKKLLIIVLSLSLPVVLIPAVTFAKSATYTVVIENMVFNPAELTVNKGDKVIWINKDFFPHTVTAENKKFDSGSVATKKSWTYKTTRKGSFDYKCTLHPTMKAHLTVN